MTLDAEMAEIATIFFQECREGLDSMESGLLSLGSAPAPEVINTIFRAAHSIKGGSATFGYAEIAGFTHGVETLLDEMRNGIRPLTPEAIQALLQACDCLREMISATEVEQPLDQPRIASLNEQISQILRERPEKEAPVSPGDSISSVDRSPVTNWRIIFEPTVDLLRVCNEPTRMFTELERLGALSARAGISHLPSFDMLDPESCYLTWQLELAGPIAKHEIEEIFAWVDNRCRVDIVQLEESSVGPPAAEAAAPTTPSEAAMAAPIQPARHTAPPAALQKAAAEAGSIRVATEKLDDIINLVGELLITQSMLSDFAEVINPSDVDRLRQGLTQLARNTRALQESVMQIRMLPISFAFNRFPRIVHDLSRKLGKKVELKLTGETTELDKTVLEKISDPLVHLVRNALDHGLETPEKRVAAGKSATGTLELSAFHEGGNIIVEVRDDGAGLNKAKILQKARERGLVAAEQELSDEQIDNLIFMPGFSTADQLSDVSGRGVGMDVVRSNINSLGGNVQIVSDPGKGSTIRVRLPLTLAILEGQLLRVGNEIYIISLLDIVETIQVRQGQLNRLAGGTEVFRLREEYLPIVKLCDQFGIEPDSRSAEDGLLVVVEADGKRVGLLVDDLLAQQQVVIKSLESNFKAVAGIAGATILGNGMVALIIDVQEFIRSVSRGRALMTAHAA